MEDDPSGSWDHYRANQLLLLLLFPFEYVPEIPGKIVESAVAVAVSEAAEAEAADGIHRKGDASRCCPKQMR